ncbi:hypothetical protein J437_LFUL016674 [Ladona fulva]|uniref:PiggyBac transposable element-derived protein domain-containing protein n=1 Tax=Ladona fulva TaxID=123851 RepID=A0A8K0KQ33_LADFU|nr:hypothetical protein J437_LFUL016674 [Ladona fulva]
MSSNRKQFPQTVKSAKLKKGEITAAFCGEQMVMKWKDKRDVLIVSTFHGTEMCEEFDKQRAPEVEEEGHHDFTGTHMDSFGFLWPGRIEVFPLLALLFALRHKMMAPHFIPYDNT